MSKNIEKDTYEKIYNNKGLKVTLSIIALIGTLVTIYAAFFQEKHSNLQYLITTNTNVLDINAEVSKLDILFDGESLKDKEENIRIINVKISNIGNKDITIDFYDGNDPIGINIHNGFLIDKPELISSSNDYIERNLKNRILSDSINIKFPNLIIDKGEFFILKLMIIHKSSITPFLTSIGKIAGQKDIEIIQTVEKKETPFFVKTFQGNIWIQIIRLLLYTIAAIIFIIVIAFSVERINSVLTRKRSKKLVERFKQKEDYSYTRMDDAIFERYIKDGEGFLEPMLILTESNEKLNEFYNASLKKVGDKPKMPSSSSEDIISNVRYESTSEKNVKLINEMVNDGIIVKDGETLTINRPMRKTIELFVIFLRENKKRGKTHKYVEAVHPIDV